MPVTAALVTGTLPTSGSTDFTASGFGTPDCAILFSGNANSPTDNPSNQLVGAFGFVDGTSDTGCGVRAENAQGDADTAGTQQAYALPFISTAADSILVGYGAALISNGVRLTLETGSTGVNRYCQALLLKGLKNAKVGTTTLNGTTPVEAPCGFRPTAVFLLTTMKSAGTVSATAQLSVGCVHWDSSAAPTQRALSYGSPDAVAFKKINTSVWDTGALRTYTDDGTFNHTITAQDPDSAGFDLVAGAATTSVVNWLAIELNDHDQFYLGTQDCSTSSDPQAFTGVGFAPVAIGINSARSTIINNTSASPTGGLSFGMATGSGAQASIILCDEDAVGTSDASSRWDGSNVLALYDHNDTVDAIAALTTFDSDGFTLDYSDTPSAAWKLMVWAIGADAGGGAPNITALSARLITANSVQPRISYS